MNKKIRLTVISCAILFGAVFLYYVFYNQFSAVAYGSRDSLPKTEPIAPDRPMLIIGDTKIFVAEATTTAQIMEGLSKKDSLPKTDGMLFLFRSEDKYRFWMPDMRFPLDIIWISAGKKIVDISKNAPPLTDASKPVFYSPRVPAQYVLEVNAGFSDEHNIVIGEDVQFISI